MLNKYFFRCINRRIKTKYEAPNISQSFLLLSQFKKRRDQAVSSLFKFRKQQKTLADTKYLVFSHKLMQQKKQKLRYEEILKQFVCYLPL